MLTNVQSLVNELTTYQIPEGFKLGGKGPAMKKLAGEIKVLFPTLTAEDKGLFTAAIARGRFAINKDIWNMFLNAVGIEAPAPAPTPAPTPAPAATNKVAGELLTMVGIQSKVTGVLLATAEKHTEKLENVDGRLGSMNNMILTLINTVSDLRKQVAELQKTTTPRRGAKAKVEDCIELEAV